MQNILRKLAAILRRAGRNDDVDLPAAEKVGLRGEEVAARHLRKRGYRILERNYRARQGEIDIIAFRDGVVAFVEVRAQTHPALVDPLHTVTRRKQRRIVKAAQKYVSLHSLHTADVRLRLDVLTVLFGPQGGVMELNHVEGAFGQSPRGLS